MPCQAAIDLATLAIQADIAKDHEKAISLYVRAADELEKAARTFPQEAAEMRAKAKEYRDRANVLTQQAQADKIAAMASGAQALQQAGNVAHQSQVAVNTAGGTGTMLGAAAVGGVAGAVLLGPMTAVVAAGAAAYATTRTDAAGDVARNTGAAAATTLLRVARGRAQASQPPARATPSSSRVSRAPSSIKACSGTPFRV